MDIITDRELLAAIDAFLARTGIAPTRFGRDAVADGSLLAHLRAGRSLSLRTVEKVAEYIRKHDVPQAASCKLTDRVSSGASPVGSDV